MYLHIQSCHVRQASLWIFYLCSIHLVFSLSIHLFPLFNVYNPIATNSTENAPQPPTSISNLFWLSKRQLNCTPKATPFSAPYLCSTTLSLCFSHPQSNLLPSRWWQAYQQRGIERQDSLELEQQVSIMLCLCPPHFGMEPSKPQTTLDLSIIWMCVKRLVSNLAMTVAIQSKISGIHWRNLQSPNHQKWGRPQQAGWQWAGIHLKVRLRDANPNSEYSEYSKGTWKSRLTQIRQTLHSLLISPEKKKRTFETGTLFYGLVLIFFVIFLN